MTNYQKQAPQGGVLLTNPSAPTLLASCQVTLAGGSILHNYFFNKTFVPTLRRAATVTALTFQLLVCCCEARQQLSRIDGGGVRVTALSDRTRQQRTPGETQHPRPRRRSVRSEYRMLMLPSLTFCIHTHAHTSEQAPRAFSLVSLLRLPTAMNSWLLSTSMLLLCLL